MSAAWTGDFIQIHPARYGLITPQRPGGTIRFTSPVAPGWSIDDSFEDRRTNRPYGPLDRSIVDYRGFHVNGERVLMEWSVGGVRVLEHPWFERHNDVDLFTRTMEVEPSDRVIAFLACGPNGRAVSVGEAVVKLDVRKDLGTVIVIPPHRERIRFTIAVTETATEPGVLAAAALMVKSSIVDLKTLIVPGPPRWTQPITTRGIVAPDDAAYVVDTITLPFDNPYRCLFFASGHDFFSNGDIAMCTAHGDVWRIRGVDARMERLDWKRMATGLFQPLGLRIVNDVVYVVGRDQISRLHDLDNDGEFDFYENFNNEGQVTMNAHEYVTCLETDKEGNFYYLKGNSEGQTEHDGSVLRVSRDGKKLDLFATGFRNANGMGIGPDGTITVSPQEGEWTPASGVFRVTQGGFYGYVPSAHRPQPPTDFDRPLCWMSRIQDNSSGGQVWVDSDRWGPLSHKMLHMSYGQCRAYLVLQEKIGDVWQGGAIPLPLRFDSGIMRGRFNSRDGHLYMSGLHGWVSNAATDGCLQRVRYTGKSLAIPVSSKTFANGVSLTFSEPLDPFSAEDVGNYQVQQWDYLWSAKYGSPEFKTSQPGIEGRDEIDLRSATVSDDHKTVFLEIDPLRPCGILSINYHLRTSQGEPLEQILNYTIHKVPESRVAATALHRPTEKQGIDPHRLKPGIAVLFEQGSGNERRQDHVVSRMLSWGIPSSVAATAEMEAGLFRAHADGYLKIPVNGDYSFALEGSGLAGLKIDDEIVIPSQALVAHAYDSHGPTEERLVGRIRLKKGHRRIQIEYTSPAAPAESVLRCLWKPSSSGDEPIAPEFLSHVADEPELIAATEIRNGRRLFADLNCVRCHASPSAPAATEKVVAPRAVPDLANLHERFTTSGLYEWVLNPHRLRPGTAMPLLLGDPESANTKAEAADLVAFLLGGADATTKPNETAEDDEKVGRGLELYETLGCIACHRFTEPDREDKYSRISLHFVGAKSVPGGIAKFIRTPHAKNPWGRMPDFRLTAEEAESLETYIRSEAKGVLGDGPAKGDAKRGAALFDSRRCNRCHAVGNSVAVRQDQLPLKPLQPGTDPTGCLAIRPSRLEPKGSTPRFVLTDNERRELALVVGNRPSTDDSVRQSIDQTASLLAKLNCQACHQRDSRTGTWHLALAEESELGLPPETLPSLTWSGEKLRANWTSQFIGGQIEVKPRNWLKARMPSFGNWANAVSSSLAAEHGWTPATQEELRSLSTRSPDPKIADLGYKLTLKNGGLDCRQCHGVGEHLPVGDKSSNVALGINFVLVKDRLQYDYFRRFVLDPPRYEVNTKMPRLAPDGARTNATGILEGDARDQFGALWQYIQSLR